MDHDALKSVEEDLDYLHIDWGPHIPEPDIRRGSAVLRRLLVEGAYGRAWRAVRFERQPQVIAVDLEALVGIENLDHIVCAMAWGANFRGVYMASPMINKGSQPIGVTTPPIRKNGYPGERLYNLSEYLESASGIAGREKATRNEIIKYVANIKGGVHLGQRTKSRERKLVKRMAKFEKIINVHTTDGILVELVSNAQAIGDSEDAMRLIGAIRKI